MAFKFVIFSALLAVASAGYFTPASRHYDAVPTIVAKSAVDEFASTHQNLGHSFDDAVAHYVKSVHSPYASIRKEDTHVNDNAYKPAVVKTVAHAVPAVYTSHSVPVVTKTVYSHPEPTHVVHAQQVKHYTHEQPEHAVYAHAAPTAAVYTHHHEVPSAATTTYNHGPAVAVYTHQSPAVSAYGSSQTVHHYSPAELVSHISFDGFGTHWSY